jgi:hypothetical protein
MDFLLLVNLPFIAKIADPSAAHSHALLILGLPSWVDPTATLTAAKGRLILCNVLGSNIPGPYQPALSGRNSPIVNHSAAMVRSSGVAGMRNAGEADAGAPLRPIACSAHWALE